MIHCSHFGKLSDNLGSSSFMSTVNHFHEAVLKYAGINSINRDQSTDIRYIK